MKKLYAGIVLFLLISAFKSFLCLYCIAGHNNVSEEDYAQMAKEIVEDSIRK